MNHGSPERDEITSALSRISSGDGEAVETLFPLVYRELHSLAQQHFRGERDDHTLQPTALVHEAYLRLLGPSSMRFEDREHFFAVCAQAMRRILVDHARAHRRQKRSGSRKRVDLNEAVELLPDTTLDVEALDEALVNLARIDERSARVVELRFFGGLKDHEIAGLLDITPRTVQRDWKYARAWLSHEIDERGDATSES